MNRPTSDLPQPQARSPEMTRARNAWGLWMAATVGLVAYLGLVRLDANVGTLRDEFTPQTIRWYLLAFAGFLLALWWNGRHPIPVVWLWVIPIVFRLLLLATTPTLSDDVYRYVWDGNVSVAGVNPYAHTLDATDLDRLDIPARRLANNPSLGTPYLPTAQLVFAASALLAPSEPLTLQVVMVAFDLMAAGIIFSLLRIAHLPQRRVMLYLWNPLVIVEVAHGAHLDALMVMLALLAVWLTLARPPPHRAWPAPLILALATLTRPLPLLLLPVLWPRWRRSQRLTYVVIVVGVLVPFAWTAGWGLSGEPTGTGVFGSARVYGAWVFNSGIYHWLARGLGRAGVAGAAGLSQMLVVALLAAVVVTVWARGRRPPASPPPEALRLLAVPLMASAILTPTLQPWYLLIVVALLPFIGGSDRWRRWLPLAPWLYLNAAVVVSYLTYLDPLRHAEIEWVRMVEWYPTLALLAIAAATRLLGPQNDPTSSPEENVTGVPASPDIVT